MPEALYPSAWVPNAVGASMRTAARWCGVHCSQARGVCGHQRHRLHTRPPGDPPRDGPRAIGCLWVPSAWEGSAPAFSCGTRCTLPTCPPPPGPAVEGGQAPDSWARAPGPPPTPPPPVGRGPPPPPRTAPGVRGPVTNTHGRDDGCGEGGGTETGKTEVETATQRETRGEALISPPNTHTLPGSTLGSRPLLLSSPLANLFPGSRR